ncbi:hypothetical protein JL101_035945 (plasmid) [Skermanella rosea]|uniref:hypothetical protein n=1 Tax=Skermanella rosea TaxID=1817965 RepID=UPI001932B078|nr:hypothetical protein [Skermanella rosea]UEM08046.1 hypothetical protein JL101_035945 [Skermanella rosea]
MPSLPEPFYLSRCSLDYMKGEHEAERLPACMVRDWKGATAYTLEVEAVRKAGGDD